MGIFNQVYLKTDLVRKCLFVGIFLSMGFLLNASPRQILTINESWKFNKGDDPEEIVSIPHSWNSYDTSTKAEAKEYYRGAAWYRKNIFIPQENAKKQCYMYFEGANQVTKLYVNKQFVGKHIGGYTRFSFDITPFLKYGEENLFEIEVDNSHNESIPPHSADFTFFGGIYRDMYLIYTDKVHISTTHYASSGVYIRTPEVSSEKATINIDTHLTNQTLQNKKLKIEQVIYDMDGKEVKKQVSTHTVVSGSSVFNQKDISIQSPQLWSPESPYLYTLKTKLYDAKSNELIDEVVNPLGFRYFSFSLDKGFNLNSKPMKLIGTSRHQDYIEKGNALSDDLHVKDVRLVKEMGANFLRVSHYPQDPVVMEMCDKLGLLTSVEIPIVNSINTSKEFTDVCVEMLKEMIYQDYNRPSVIMWAYMNEVLMRTNIPEEDKANFENVKVYRDKVADLAQILEDIIRKEDPSRYTMMAIDDSPSKYSNTRLPFIPQILGLNLYIGWYKGAINDLESTIQKYRQLYPNQILMLTEYGADVDTRLHAFPPERYDYTVEYGNLYHTHHLDFILKTPDLVGSAIWNLNDFYSFGRNSAVPRVNNKGVVGLKRDKKDSYYLYKASLTTDPLVKIGSSDWTVRGGVSNNGTCVQPIMVYSNLGKVEVFHNGKSLGVKTSEKSYTEWDIAFVDGANTIEAVGSKDNKIVRDIYTTDFRLYPMYPAKEGFSELNVNLGSSCYFEDKESDIIWIPEQEYKAGSWGYIGGQRQGDVSWHGKLPFVEVDVLGTDKDPLFQTQREDIEAFRADVPAGEYAVYFYWAELVTKKNKESLVYHLGNNKGLESSGEREFNVLINGKKVSKLSPLEDFGEQRAAIVKHVISTENDEGLNIQFEKIKGAPVLNAIRIYKIY